MPAPRASFRPIRYLPTKRKRLPGLTRTHSRNESTITSDPARSPASERLWQDQPLSTGRGMLDLSATWDATTLTASTQGLITQFSRAAGGGFLFTPYTFRRVKVTPLGLIYLQGPSFQAAAFTIFWREQPERLEDAFLVKRFATQHCGGRAYRIIKFDAALHPLPHFSK